MKSVGGTIVQPGASPKPGGINLPGWRREIQRLPRNPRNVNAFSRLSPINPVNSGFDFKGIIFRRVLGIGAAVFWPDTLGDGSIDVTNPRFQAMVTDPSSLGDHGFVQVGNAWYPEFAAPGVARHVAQGLHEPRPDIRPYGVSGVDTASLLSTDTWSAIADAWGRVSDMLDATQQKLAQRSKDIAVGLSNNVIDLALGQGDFRTVSMEASRQLSMLVTFREKYGDQLDAARLSELTGLISVEQVEIWRARDEAAYQSRLQANASFMERALEDQRRIVEMNLRRQQYQREVARLERELIRLEREAKRAAEQLRRQLVQQARQLEADLRAVHMSEILAGRTPFSETGYSENRFVFVSPDAFSEFGYTENRFVFVSPDAFSETGYTENRKVVFTRDPFYETYDPPGDPVPDPQPPVEPRPVDPGGVPSPDEPPITPVDPLVGRVDVVVTPQGVSARSRPQRMRRTRRNAPRKSDSKVGGQYRAALAFISQTYGRYDQFVEYAEAFFNNLVPVGRPDPLKWRSFKDGEDTVFRPRSYRVAYELMLSGEAELDMEGFLRDLIVMELEDRLFGLQSPLLNEANQRPVGLGFGPAL